MSLWTRLQDRHIYSPKCCIAIKTWCRRKKKKKQDTSFSMNFRNRNVGVCHSLLQITAACLIHRLYSSPASACPDMSQWDKKLGQGFLGDSSDRPDMAELGHLSDQAGTSNLPKNHKMQKLKDVEIVFSAVIVVLTLPAGGSRSLKAHGSTVVSCSTGLTLVLAYKARC